MTVTVYYNITFGRGEGSDSYDYELELTPEEEAAYQKARKNYIPFDKVPELREALSRAYDEIYDIEEENAEELYGEDSDSDSWSLNVYFSEDDYDDEDDEEYEDEDDEEYEDDEADENDDEENDDGEEPEQEIIRIPEEEFEGAIELSLFSD